MYIGSDSLYILNSSTSSGWRGETSGQPLSSGIGVMAKVTNTAIFNGTPSNGPKLIPGSTVAGESFSLFGNPYPSSINAEKLIKNNRNNLAFESVYLYYSDSQGAYPDMNDFYAVNETGSSHPNLDSSLSALTLASAQGFALQMSGTPSVITMDNTIRTATATGFKSGPMPKFWIGTVPPAGSVAHALIGLSEEAVPNADRQMDALNTPGSYGFFPVKSGSPMCIGTFAMDEDSTYVPLFFNGIQKGKYILSINKMNGLSVGQEFFLHDKIGQTYHNLKSGPYNLDHQNDNDSSRFEIVLYNPDAHVGVATVANKGYLKLASRNGEFALINPGKLPVNKVEVFDVSGRLLQEINLNLTTMERVQLDLLPQNHSIVFLKCYLVNSVENFKILR